MAAPDEYDIVSSSLAAVIRQSLSTPFRKECYLLLGVTNNMDAKNVICTLLKSNDNTSKATVGETRPSQSEKCDGCSSNQQGLLESQKLIFEACSPGKINDEITLPVPEDHDLLKSGTALVSVCSQGQKLGTAEVHSDEEKQLDWDTD